jgi:putative glutamine amidotransferase
VKPKVGIIPDRRDRVSDKYLAKLRAAGAEPVVLPWSEYREEIMRVLKRVQAVLLTGGGDFVEGELYERFTPEVRQTLRDVHKERQAAEWITLDVARERGLPAFGICRGFQAINVHAGGTLIADITLDLKGAEIPEHRLVKGEDLKMPDHDVLFDADSRLGRLAGLTSAAVREDNRIRLRVNNSHHQALSKIGAGLRAAAWAEDGIVEAIESVPEAKTFWFGVQFHPERMEDDFSRKLFELFVKNIEQRA